jgi:probable F420-dependent oxidoreductase
MKIGVLPAFVPELIVDPDWVARFARGLEECGAESVWAVEHVLVAKDYEPRYSYSESGRMRGNAPMPDPIEWLSFVAAVTEHLVLGTGVMILPLHSPVVLAKRVATLDALSSGRVVLGVGSGWQIEEYRACNVPYEQRGALLDEHIDVLRDLWAPGHRTYHGPTVSYVEVESEPKPARAGGPPIVVGGSTVRAAARAGRTGDGWFPYVISPDDYAARVEVVRATAVEHGRDPASIELTVWPSSWQPGSSVDAATVARYAETGLDRMIVSAQEARSTAIDDIRRFIDDVRAHVVDRLR